MGLFREHLINVVACLVAIDLSVAAVVLYDRNRPVTTMVSAGAPASNPAPPASGPKPQAPQPSVTTAAPTGTQPVATAPAPPSTISAPSTRPPAVSTGASTPTRPRPEGRATGRGATTPTSGPAGAATPPPPPPSATGTPAQPATDEGPGPPTRSAPPEPSTTGTSPPSKATPPPSVTTSGVWTVMSDAGGDTVLDSSGAPKANARADIVEGRATNTTKAIGFGVKVADPVEPARDPNWNSVTTFVLWEIDTSGDDRPDFEVEYFIEGGKLIAGVNRVAANGRQAACEAEAGYMSETYVVGIDPACLGAPASLSYRASVYYGVDPSNADAGSVTDATPDGGMSAPLRRTSA